MSRERVEQLNKIVFDAINELRSIKAMDSSVRVGYSSSVESILNAYREGDLAFNNAAELLDVKIRATCINCGLPSVKNHHPDAGKIAHINRVGCGLGCLPCAERRATGRHRVYADFTLWLMDEIAEEEDDGIRNALSKVKQKIESLEQNRKAEFHERL